MSIYFIFCDEYGKYQKEKTEKYLKSHPYYIRATLIINASEWKKLNSDFIDLKKNYNLPIEKELKWSYLWTLRSYKKNNKKIPEKDDIKYFEHFDYHVLIDFVTDSLNLLKQLNYSKIICTITNNKKVNNICEVNILKMHLQEIMQRIEMELQNDSNNLGVFFIDPISKEKNALLKNIYFDLFQNGDFIKNYSHIKDGLNIEYSHQSVGIQITDYIAGAFGSFIKSFDSNNYEKGVNMFLNSIHPLLRKSDNGNIWGYGIREVPSNIDFRNYLKSNFDKIINQPSASLPSVDIF